MSSAEPKPKKPRKPRAPKPPKPPKKRKLTKSEQWLQLTARQVGVYNCRDTLSTARLAKHLPTIFAKQGTEEYYRREVWPTVAPVLAMQRRGLAVDISERSRVRKQFEDELAETDGTVLSLASNADLNLNSTKQKAELLFGKLGLRSTRKTESGAPSTDTEALATILRNLRKMDEHARPILEGLFHRSRIKTILERYLDFHVGNDGRVRPRIKFTGTKTERLAYAEPALQQFPDEVRSFVVAEPGMCFVAADSRQLEARINAILSGDMPSLEAFARGESIHEVNARELFSYTQEQWDTLSEEQQKAAKNFAKSFFYGIVYGGEAESIKTKLYCPCPKCIGKIPPSITISRLEMRRIADRWFGRHPAVLRFRTELRDQVARFHYYQSPFGAKRWVFGPWRDVEREVYNLPMQWCAARLTNRAMTRLHTLGAPIVLQMHDSLMLEVPEQEADEWTARLREEMERPVPELGGAVFPVDCKRGHRWFDL